MKPRTSAQLKISRAQDHLVNIEEIIGDVGPFSYVYTVDAKTGDSSIGAVRNEPEYSDLVLTISDAIANLRDAIDHAYWEVVSPFTKNEKEKRAVQFPFAKERKYFGDRCVQCLANKVSREFVEELVKLGSYAGEGGDRTLVLLNDVSNQGKHRNLVPVSYQVNYSDQAVRELVPRFPPNLKGIFAFGNNVVDIGWSDTPFSMNEWIIESVGADGVLRTELNWPVDVRYLSHSTNGDEFILETLQEILDTTIKVVSILEAFIPDGN